LCSLTVVCGAILVVAIMPAGTLHSSVEPTYAQCVCLTFTSFAVLCHAVPPPSNTQIQAIAGELDRMASSLLDASSGVSRVMSAVNEGFPGPMLNSTLDGIRQQVRGGGGSCLVQHMA
jgi:hypothetical protein